MRRWLLPGLAAVLAASGIMLLAVACSTPRQSVSVIPPSVSTRAPVSIPAATASPAGGFPARSAPVRILIPAIGVNAPVTELGLNADGSLQVPPLADLNLAGWYEYGPSPGQEGPAVIAGHIDTTAGCAVFCRLRYLTRGEKITVMLADGHEVTFAVDGLQQAPKTEFPTKAVYGRVPYAALRLVTCGGTFDYATGHYLSNIIVFAHAV